MKLSFDKEEIKYALLVYFFTKTGSRLQTEDVDITNVDAYYVGDNDYIEKLEITIEPKGKPGTGEC